MAYRKEMFKVLDEFYNTITIAEKVGWGSDKFESREQELAVKGIMSMLNTCTEYGKLSERLLKEEMETIPENIIDMTIRIAEHVNYYLNNKAISRLEEMTIDNGDGTLTWRH